MLQKSQKSPKPSDPAHPFRLPTVPRAWALISLRAGPWITAAPLTGVQH